MRSLTAVFSSESAFSLAETTPVTTMVTTLPPPDDIERASKFTREPFLSEGEDPASLLAPGTAHRRAFDSALAEMDAGLKVPSVAWRRNFSLLLGLERLLSQDEPEEWRRDLRRATFAGKPLGSKEFLDNVKKRSEAGEAVDSAKFSV